MSAGYSGTPLVKKLGIKPGFAVRIIDAPAHYFELLGDLPPGIRIHEDPGELDFIHLFITERDRLFGQLAAIKDSIHRQGMIWVSWTKKSSKNFSGISEDMIRDAALELGLVDVKVCAIDENWSGLKLVYRLKDR